MSNLNVRLEEKTRSALFVAQIASTLGAQGAIVAEEGYGNPDADFIQCIVELEKAGVKTVGITNECTGRDGRSQLWWLWIPGLMPLSPRVMFPNYWICRLWIK